MTKGPESNGSRVRQQIIETAIRLFAQKGFRGTTTKEIALSASVNEVTIFRHFASKQDLYSAILDVKSAQAGVTRWLPELDQFAGRRDDEGLFLFVARKVLAHYRQDPDFLRLKLYSSLEGHEFAQEYRTRQVCPLFQYLNRYIIERQREGAFRRCDPAIAIQCFLGSVYNHATSRYFGAVDFIKLSEEATAKSFTSLFLRGIQADLVSKSEGERG
ncbi:MAG TPA: TetR/AcrR family transcriptional regulator [Blastocatellia bacterium]|nr:TetR/AcrR family transcriptional regulator [Blastocatellia bacterium]